VKKLNLFSKTFRKHLKKGNTPLEEMAKDVGNLKGVFSFVARDLNGKIIAQEEYDNLIVNQSKSSIIRLLGQGTSPNIGAINPASFKISRMRFSNDTGTLGGDRGIASPHKLEYYDISEPSSRISTPPDYTVGVKRFGGGDFNATECRGLDGTSADINYRHDWKTSYNNASNPSTGYETALNGKVFKLKDGKRPPSAGTVVFTFYKTFSGGEEKIEEHHYNFKPANSGIESIYTKDQFSNKPFKIVNYKINGKFYHVSTPMSSGTIFSLIGDIKTTEIGTTENNNTNSRVLYDYTQGVVGWKIYVEEIQSGTVMPTDTVRASGDAPDIGNDVWSRCEVSYTIGKHNVVNLIIPKIGANKGYGKSNSIRYGSSQETDYYNILDASYQDCSDDYIDDYAVSFYINMPTNHGNGISPNKELLQYTKAYLFTENDEMFSSIMFPSPEFKKNSEKSFQVSWKIIAPVE